MWTIVESLAVTEYLSSGEYGMVFTIKLKGNLSYYVNCMILPVILLSCDNRYVCFPGRQWRKNGFQYDSISIICNIYDDRFI